MPPRRTLCKLFSSSLFRPRFRPLEFTSHCFRFGNVFRLRCLYAASQQNIDGRSGSRLINPIPRSDMNTHLGNAFADGLAIAEISKGRTTKASQDSGLCFLVGQIGQPRIEIGRPNKCIHALLSVSTRILSASGPCVFRPSRKLAKPTHFACTGGMHRSFPFGCAQGQDDKSKLG